MIKVHFYAELFFRNEVHCFMAEEEGKAPDWKGEEEMLSIGTRISGQG